MKKPSTATDCRAVIESSGRLDSYTVPDLQSQLNEVIENGPSLVAIDLSAVDFIDSRALAVIVQGMHNCRDAHIHYCIVGPTEAVRRIFSLTKLDKAIDIFATVDEASQYFE